MTAWRVQARQAASPRIRSMDTSTAPGGVPTLHVTSITPLATFTGTLGNLITAGKIDNGAGAAEIS